MYRVVLVVLLSIWTTGCVTLSARPTREPPARPAALEAYYDRGTSYTNYHLEFRREFPNYVVSRYLLESSYGLVTLDYFQLPKPSSEVVFLYPALGGKNSIENYFADYFTKNGIESVVVHRNNDFKDPSNFDRMEEVLRNTVIRDRIVLDFFEKNFGKTEFGSFGISRGAFNVASTAGVDPRLKYNVLAMGGTDLVGVFQRSDQPRIRKYIDGVALVKKMTREQIFDNLRSNLMTDPKYLASFLDPKNTLLFLSALDDTVPYRYGRMLRRQIGYPRTVVLLANHYTSLLYTQIIKVFPPEPSLCVFPVAYIEGEALAFFNKKFNRRSYSLKLLPVKVLQWPINVMARVGDMIWEGVREYRQETPKWQVVRGLQKDESDKEVAVTEVKEADCVVPTSIALPKT